MIKNKMARLVGSAMAAALMFSAIAPAVEASAMEVEGTAITQEYNYELAYALDEISIATNIMENENLLDRDNYDRMVIFANTAVQRVANMDQEDESVKDIHRLAGEISTLDNTILRRLMNDVECLQNATEDTKDAWIDALNEAIIYARENTNLNYNTVYAATEILHQAAGVQ